MKTEERKAKHIEICINQNVELGSTWLNKIRLMPKTLPELNMKKIDTSIEFFGKTLDSPLIIAGMTGGIELGKRINRKLAETAEKHKISMGLGSQRMMLQNKALADTYKVRDVAPNILLFGNIGVTQAKEYSNKELQEALNVVGADALCIHINAAQEIFQEEGDTDFENCAKTISRVTKEIPVVAKAVGQGIDRDTAIKLQSAGVKAIDVAGCGGTDWAKIDALLSRKDSSTFKNWGIPTAASILECGKTVPLIASGGIRTGLDMAKSIALGADVCAMALPFLKAWKNNTLEQFTSRIKDEFRAVMYLCGCEKVKELQKVDYVLFDELKQYAEQRIHYQQNIK